MLEELRRSEVENVYVHAMFFLVECSASVSACARVFLHIRVDVSRVDGENN